MDEEKNSEEPLMNPNEVHEANVLNNTDAIILCDETGSVKYQNKSVTLTLTRTSLILESIKKRSSELTLSLSSFIGATIRNDGKYAGKVLLIHLFAHPSRSCCSCCSSGSGKRKHSTVDLLFTNDRDCMNWMNAINTILCQSTLTRDKEGMIQPPPSRRYLVFVNPVGGTGIAVQIWNRVSIFLTQASIEYELLITERANHAKDVMTSRNLDDIHAVVIIGGDGLVFEVISGVLARHDSEKQFQRLIFAPVPGGSGNGLIKSILHESGEDYSPENAIFVAVRGKPALLDLSQVQTRSHGHVSFLILGWGFISDCDILSEGMRWMGEIRFTVAAVYRLGIKKLYPGKLSMLLESQEHPRGVSSKSALLPPISEPLDTSTGNWKVIEDDFIFVWVLQTSHCSASMYSCPGATLNDGVLTILVVRNISRLSLLTMLLDIDNGDHINHPGLEIYKALAYRLEPKTDEGLFSLDGEVVEYGPIQGEVQPGAMKVFTLQADN